VRVENRQPSEHRPDTPADRIWIPLANTKTPGKYFFASSAEKIPPVAAAVSAARRGAPPATMHEAAGTAAATAFSQGIAAEPE
jgi:hypothetical protein